MMYWDTGHMGGWGYAFMMIGMLLFWALVIIAVIALIRGTGRSGREHGHSAPPPVRPTAEELLAERFARGEIEADEYQRRAQVLRQAVDVAAPGPKDASS